jgi:predicted NAD/FAD-binding protein
MTSAAPPAVPFAPGPRPRVAVIGAGVAGLTAAYLLDRSHDVTLFERNDYPGGHTHTVVLDRGPDAGTPVDTGFIVMNPRNYPLFSRLLAHLGVRLQGSDMSFSYHCERTGFHYAGTGLNGLFSQRRNLVSPAFWRLLRDIPRFNSRTRRDLAEGRLAGLALGEYVDRLGLSAEFGERYLYAMAAAIWSSPAAAIRRFPAESFARFFENHGLLSLAEVPQWQTVAGGSRTYVEELLRRFGGRLRLAAPVREVRRAPDGVTVATADGAERFDQAVIAAHADEALALLADPTAEERRRLGAWTYSANRTVLHTDPAVLPPRRRAWASWNYAREADAGPGSAGAGEGAPVSLTYYMNRLQRLTADAPYCVTLNRAAPIAERHVIRELLYTHPRYTQESLATQAELRRWNGNHRTWFCGSYFGYGFHEDAVRSGVEVARGLGWRDETGIFG